MLKRCLQKNPTVRNVSTARWLKRLITSINLAKPTSACLLTILLTHHVNAGEVLSAFPENATQSQRYIIYAHGRIIETEGINAVSPRFGPYEYSDITKALAQGDADVIALVREGETDAHRYADTLAQQINALISQGVRPEHITLAGFSKGGYITLLTARRLKYPSLRYVVMAGCVAGITDGTDLNADGLQGAVLSMVDAADDLSFSCAPLFARNPQLSQTKDIIFQTGTGHGLFYRVDPVWIDEVLS